MAPKSSDDEDDIVLMDEDTDTSIIAEVETSDSELAPDSARVSNSVEAAEPVQPKTSSHSAEGVLDPTRLYLSEIGASKLLTAEEEVHYARLAQKGDAAGRQRMIESNLRLVVKIARRYTLFNLCYLVDTPDH